MCARVHGSHVSRFHVSLTARDELTDFTLCDDPMREDPVLCTPSCGSVSHPVTDYVSLITITRQACVCISLSPCLSDWFHLCCLCCNDMRALSPQKSED